MIRTSASYGKKAHEQLKEKKLVEAEIQFESSFSSHSSVSLLHPQTSPTASTHTNNISFFKHKPKIPTSSSSTWERFKSRCIASLPLMDSSSLLESVSPLSLPSTRVFHVRLIYDMIAFRVRKRTSTSPTPPCIRRKETNSKERCPYSTKCWHTSRKCTSISNESMTARTDPPSPFPISSHQK